MDCCNIWEKFDEKNNLIKEYEHWKLLIRKNHPYLGSCVVITKKHHEKFSELNNDEIIEYLAIVKEIENALKNAFNYDVIHHLMLMFKDKHTHFHILPRYKEPREFAGIKWIDEFTPNPLGKRNDIDQQILDKIIEEISRFL
jgi:diadenosine tetraphosphate (Ap4A) HIT family hydrolase